MARFSPFSDKRPPVLVETVTLTNQRTGQTDEVSLQYLDDILSEKANDIALKLTFQYVGVPEQDIEPQMDFPAVDGQYIDVSATLCQKVAEIYVMQTPRADQGVIYDCNELIAFAATEASTGIWTQLQEAKNELGKKGNKRKNEFRASAINGLKTPSGSTNPTRKSLLEQTPSSAESTNDSDTSVIEPTDLLSVSRVERYLEDALAVKSNRSPTPT